jgi:hypothetical protein
MALVATAARAAIKCIMLHCVNSTHVFPIVIYQIHAKTLCM